MALFICTSAVAPANRVALTGETPSATATDEPTDALLAENAVAVMEFGVTLPMGGGAERFAVPAFASTYLLLATSVGFAGSGAIGDFTKVFTPPSVWSSLTWT